MTACDYAECAPRVYVAAVMDNGRLVYLLQPRPIVLGPFRIMFGDHAWVMRQCDKTLSAFELKASLQDCLDRYRLDWVSGDGFKFMAVPGTDGMARMYMAFNFLLLQPLPPDLASKAIGLNTGVHVDPAGPDFYLHGGMV